MVAVEAVDLNAVEATVVASEVEGYGVDTEVRETDVTLASTDVTEPEVITRAAGTFGPAVKGTSVEEVVVVTDVLSSGTFSLGLITRIIGPVRRIRTRMCIYPA